MQQAATKGRAVIGIEARPGFFHAEPLQGEGTGQAAAVAATGIGDDDFGLGLGVAFAQRGQQRGMVALVQHVTGDDQFEAAKSVIRHCPFQVMEMRNAQVIEAATIALAKGTEAFAAERMNHGIRKALAGRAVDTI